MFACCRCADGIEVARRTCGGHGYSALSGLPRLFASYVQNVTWEGDNNVLYLQVGGKSCSFIQFPVGMLCLRRLVELFAHLRRPRRCSPWLVGAPDQCVAMPVNGMFQPSAESVASSSYYH
jgi:hypothetical protein